MPNRKKDTNAPPSDKGPTNLQVLGSNLTEPQSCWGYFEKCSNPRMCEFSIQNRQNMSTVWIPGKAVSPIPPRIIQPTKIYCTHMGMVPHFTGFVPGYQYKCGGTFGALTKNPLGK
ncbi:ciliary microtubule inner protein 2B-like [Rhodnius prolixus]|uniref:Uncharacterized protein n=1 Tax=Rhodnius prolixus TaxID=13249 RepID=T1I796_RHOPR